MNAEHFCHGHDLEKDCREDLLDRMTNLFPRAWAWASLIILGGILAVMIPIVWASISSTKTEITDSINQNKECIAKNERTSSLNQQSLGHLKEGMDKLEEGQERIIKILMRDRNAPEGRHTP